MTKTHMDLSEVLAKHDQENFLRTIAEAVLQLMMEADVEGLIGSPGDGQASGPCPSGQPLRACQL